MTDYTLDEEARRTLTEKVLGNKNIGYGCKTGCGCIFTDKYKTEDGCQQCDHHFKVYPSFKTASDMHALVVAMVEKGWWEDFHDYANDLYTSPGCTGRCSHSGFTAWLLLCPKRFCWLCWQSKCWEG